MKDCSTPFAFSIIPGLEGATLVRSSGPTQSNARHSHESLVFGAILSGKRTLRIDPESYEAGPGTVVCLPPEKPHACTDSDDCHYLMMTIPTNLACTLGFDTSFASKLPVLDDPLLFGDILRLGDAIQHSAAPLEIQSRLISILSSLTHAPQASTTRSIPPNIEKAILHIEAVPCTDMRLDTLAEIVNLSPCRFNRLFTRAMGMPPYEYHHLLKTREAKRLIAEGISLADTAAQCGFSDQSHMNRVFKKITGMTPGQYAKAFK